MIHNLMPQHATACPAPLDEFVQQMRVQPSRAGCQVVRKLPHALRSTRPSMQNGNKGSTELTAGARGRTVVPDVWRNRLQSLRDA